MQIYLGTWTLEHSSYLKIMLILSLNLEHPVAEVNKVTLQDLHRLVASVLLREPLNRARVTEYHVGRRVSPFCSTE